MMTYTVPIVPKGPGIHTCISLYAFNYLLFSIIIICCYLTPDLGIGSVYTKIIIVRPALTVNRLPDAVMVCDRDVDLL